MADQDDLVTDETEQLGDEEMGDAEAEATAAAGADDDIDNDRTGLEDIEPNVQEVTTFLDSRSSYLRSPIVHLEIGQTAASTTLYAHQGLLTQSPFFSNQIQQFDDNTAVRSINLIEDDLGATAAVLEYLYRGDYFPVLENNTSMEYDASVPQPDNDGVALLRHARVYTLAKKWSLPALAQLAHKKIHLTQSTARGEIAYARFIYKETPTEDNHIRKPVAQFWATRSHVLRHEAEKEFQHMCLEFPQFAFDVLSLVLDAQEKRSQRPEASSASGRKRQRMSNAIASDLVPVRNSDIADAHDQEGLGKDVERLQLGKLLQHAIGTLYTRDGYTRVRFTKQQVPCLPLICLTRRAFWLRRECQYIGDWKGSPQNAAR
nr:hypothetical protein CFP56_11249 [Quercus suber]